MYLREQWPECTCVSIQLERRFVYQTEGRQRHKEIWMLIWMPDEKVSGYVARKSPRDAWEVLRRMSGRRIFHSIRKSERANLLGMLLSYTGLKGGSFYTEMSAFRHCIRLVFGCAESSATLCARHMQSYCIRPPPPQ